MLRVRSSSLYRRPESFPANGGISRSCVALFHIWSILQSFRKLTSPVVRESSISELNDLSSFVRRAVVALDLSLLTKFWRLRRDTISWRASIYIHLPFLVSKPIAKEMINFHHKLKYIRCTRLYWISEINFLFIRSNSFNLFLFTKVHKIVGKFPTCVFRVEKFYLYINPVKIPSKDQLWSSLYYSDNILLYLQISHWFLKFNGICRVNVVPKFRRGICIAKLQKNKAIGI